MEILWLDIGYLFNLVGFQAIFSIQYPAGYPVQCASLSTCELTISYIISRVLFIIVLLLNKFSRHLYAVQFFVSFYAKCKLFVVNLITTTSGLRDYQDAKADVILKYSADEASFWYTGSVHCTVPVPGI
jgi:hypothetical protein